MSCSSIDHLFVSRLRLSSIRGVILLSFVAALLAAHADRASATLVGDLVHGEMLFKDFPGLGNMFDPAPKPGCMECTVPDFPASSGLQPFAMVLEPDLGFPEFVFRDVGFLDVTADIDEHTIDVKVLNTSGSPATEAPFGWEIRITDMDWVNGPPGLLTSAMVDDDTLFPGLTASVINGGTGILIDFPGRATGTPGTGPANVAQDVLDAYIANGMLTATISFTAEHIPEPATCALFATALLAIVGSRQRLV
jgi:hypothetical protein